jgi:hypothetical protein
VPLSLLVQERASYARRTGAILCLDEIASLRLLEGRLVAEPAVAADRQVTKGVGPIRRQHTLRHTQF